MKKVSLKLKWGNPKYITVDKQVICILTAVWHGESFKAKGVAKCSDEDEYDFKKGSKLAFLRAKERILKDVYWHMGGYDREKSYSTIINEYIAEWGVIMETRMRRHHITEEINKLCNG